MSREVRSYIWYCYCNTVKWRISIIYELTLIAKSVYLFFNYEYFTKTHLCYEFKFSQVFRLGLAQCYILVSIFVWKKLWFKNFSRISYVCHRNSGIFVLLVDIIYTKIVKFVKIHSWNYTHFYFFFYSNI